MKKKFINGFSITSIINLLSLSVILTFSKKPVANKSFRKVFINSGLNVFISFGAIDCIVFSDIFLLPLIITKSLALTKFGIKRKKN